MLSIHFFSPLLYVIFVKCIQLINPCPQSKLMRFFRKIHNIILSILSFLMLVGILIGSYSVGKLTSFKNLICLSFNNNLLVNKSVNIFLYSKYLEWLDTLFLHLSGKKISMLQYTHHMTTGINVYINSINYVSSKILIPMFLNCLVHIPMYYYFAYPKGFLYKYKVWITRSQIIQHIIVVILACYSFFLSNCEENMFGTIIGLLLYFMYFIYFVLFYLKTYVKKIN